VSGSERKREIRRRRHRKEKLAHLKRRMETANTSERAAIEEKVRLLTPGYARILENWESREE
jgi:hypothetical protein